MKTPQDKSMASSIAVVTPSIIPGNSSKKYNSGDNLVKEGSMRYLFNGKISCIELSYWDASRGEEQLQVIDKQIGSQVPVIMTGTNSIKNSFGIFNAQSPKSLSDIAQDRYIAILFAGLFGTEEMTSSGSLSFEDERLYAIQGILENGIISTRCQTTYNSLVNSIPNAEEKIFNTGCVSTSPLHNFYKKYSANVANGCQSVLFSFTCRNDSSELEVEDLKSLIGFFGHESITVIVNQQRITDDLADLINLFSLPFVDATTMDCTSYLAFLSRFDFHYGSRAHVHLPMLAMGISTILTGFELRHAVFQRNYRQRQARCGEACHHLPALNGFDFSEAEDILIREAGQRTKMRRSLISSISEYKPSYNITHHNQWRKRHDLCTSILNSLPVENLSICEIGAGTGGVMEYASQAGIKYRGYDLEPRTSSIARFDANVDSLSCNESNEVLIALGLLEYIEDIPGFLRRVLRNFSKAVVTLNVGTSIIDESEYARIRFEEAKEMLNWSISNYTLESFRDLLSRNDLTIVSCKPTKYGSKDRLYCEYMFELDKSLL